MRAPTAEDRDAAHAEYEASEEYLRDKAEAEARQLSNQTDAATDSTANQSNPKQSAASLIVELALERYDFGVTEEGQPYAVKPGRHVVRMLRGGKSSLRAELSQAYYQTYKKAAPQQALADALLVLEGQAQEQDPDRVHLRVAAANDTVWLDLGDAAETVVQINGYGWQVGNGTEHVPVLFRRTGLTGAMPLPADVEDVKSLPSLVAISQLWDQINVSDADRPLVLAWLIAAIIDPDSPHPVLSLFGEQGTAKSTTTRRIVEVIDPSPVPLRKPPRDPEQWVTAAQGSWVVGLDNMSQVPDWLSDSLCRAATGDGDVRRALYTDSDLAVLAFRRCIVLNGIDVGAVRGDLADRILMTNLDRIEESARLTERQLSDQWRKAYPTILGGLLQMSADVMRLLPSVRLASSPRMADFARILAALDELCGSTASERYAEQSQIMAQDSLSSDPFLAYMDEAQPEFTGHAADLLQQVTPTTLGWRPPRSWPRDARHVTSILKRNAPRVKEGQLGHRGRTGPQPLRRLDHYSSREGPYFTSATSAEWPLLAVLRQRQLHGIPILHGRVMITFEQALQNLIAAFTEQALDDYLASLPACGAIFPCLFLVSFSGCPRHSGIGGLEEQVVGPTSQTYKPIATKSARVCGWMSRPTIALDRWPSLQPSGQKYFNYTPTN